MFSTYINDNTLLIVTPDSRSIESFKNTLIHHKVKTNKWLNKGYKFTSKDPRKFTLELIENSGNDTKIDSLQVTYNDVTKTQDTLFMSRLYELANIQMFMMYEYEYMPNIPLLSIEGVLIDKPLCESVFETSDYLDASFTLEPDDII